MTNTWLKSIKLEMFRDILETSAPWEIRPKYFWKNNLFDVARFLCFFFVKKFICKFSSKLAMSCITEIKIYFLLWLIFPVEDKFLLKS